MVAARGRALVRALGAGRAAARRFAQLRVLSGQAAAPRGATPGKRNGPASAAARARRPRPPRARTPPAALALARHGGPRRARRRLAALALADRVTRSNRERARRGAGRSRGLGAAPSRRAGRRRPRAPHFVCRREGIHARRGGCRLHSPSSSSLRPSPRSSHIIAPLSRPRASSAGGSETQPRGDDGPRVYWVAPRGLGVPRRPGLHSRAARRLATKTRAVNRRGFA